MSPEHEPDAQERAAIRAERSAERAAERADRLAERDRERKAQGQLNRNLLLFAAATLIAAAAMAVLASHSPPDRSVGTLLLALSALGLLLVGLIVLTVLGYRIRREATDARDAEFKGILNYVALAGLPFLVLAGGVITYWLINRSGEGQPGTLPDQLAITFFLAFSVIALLLALSMTTIFFSWAKLADRHQALGLPEGSVRAVISLALIIIFAITAVFLYSRVSTTTFFETKGLTEEEVAQIPVAERLEVIAEPTPSPDPNATPLAPTVTPEPVEQRFTVRRIDPAQARGDDLAQQIITTVSTLVVAVSAFYFGSAAVKTAADTVGAGGAKGLKIVSPRPPAKLRRTDDGGYEDLDIEVQATPAGLAVKAVILSGDTGGAIPQLEPGSFRYGANDPGSMVLLGFSLISDTTVEATLLVENPADEGDEGDEISEDNEEDDGTKPRAPDPAPSPGQATEPSDENLDDVPEGGEPDVGADGVPERDDSDIADLDEAVVDEDEAATEVPDVDADKEPDEESEAKEDQPATRTRQPRRTTSSDPLTRIMKEEASKPRRRRGDFFTPS